MNSSLLLMLLRGGHHDWMMCFFALQVQRIDLDLKIKGSLFTFSV